VADYKLLTKPGELVSGSIDTGNPNAPREITVTTNGESTTYRQNMSSDDPGIKGKFFSTRNGTVWDGEPAAGNAVREAQSKKIDDAKVSDAIKEKFKEQNAANPNLKSDTEGGDTEGGKDEGKELLTAFGEQKEAVTTAGRGSYDKNLRYPIAELPRDVDFMKITMLQYIPGKFQSGRKNRASNRKMSSLGSVLLPIPPGLADSNTTNWGESSMNNLQMAGATAAKEIMNADDFKGFTGQIGSQIGEMLDTARKDGGELGNYAKTALMGQIGALGNNTAQLLARGQGQVINPNMELLFTGPARRAFNYSFRLTARSEKETLAIKKIIRFFKQGMAAKQSVGSGLYLDTPNVFDVCFHSGYSNQHPFLFKMKRTAITGFTVNYVPDGTYMTLPNKSMTAYEIGMSMQELDPIFDQDYTDLDGNDDSMIGY